MGEWRFDKERGVEVEVPRPQQHCSPAPVTVTLPPLPESVRGLATDPFAASALLLSSICLWKLFQRGSVSSALTPDGQTAPSRRSSISWTRDEPWRPPTAPRPRIPSTSSSSDGPALVSAMKGVGRDVRPARFDRRGSGSTTSLEISAPPSTTKASFSSSELESTMPYA